MNLFVASLLSAAGIILIVGISSIIFVAGERARARFGPARAVSGDDIEAAAAVAAVRAHMSKRNG